MPALDFPATPTDGQVFENWIYSSAKQAWQSRPLTPAKTVNSPVAPSSPAAGDQWFNTDTGQLFIYYTDANTSQWVESRAPITADGYISPNYIINGAFDIWQRGTTFSHINTAIYGADRWGIFRPGFAAGASSSRQLTGLTSFQHGMRVQRSSGNTSTAGIFAVNTFETVNSLPLAGKTVTFSFYARRGANFSGTSGNVDAYVITGTGTDQNLWGTYTGYAVAVTGSASLTSSWQRFSYTGPVAANVTQISVQIGMTPTGTAGADDWFEITGVQLEEGSVATPFRRNANSIQGEFATCLRYFNRFSFANGDLKPFITKLSPTGSGAGYGVLLLPVPMRVAPTVSFSAPSTFQTHVPGVLINSPTAISSLTIDNSPRTIQISTSGSSSFTFGQAVDLQWNSSGGGIIDISAEL